MKWFAFVMMVVGCLAPAEEVSPVVIGRKIFMDTSLSHPVGQGCVFCHDPKAAFADSRRVTPGAVKWRKARLSRDSESRRYGGFKADGSGA
ncbi:MAG: hypothetical protein CMO60_00325 [Verrucomicrobiales bacterium]|nr:hypothetical protein [Verrucomicrobiales bacterium]